MERMISLKTLFPRRISAIVVLLFMHIYNVEIHTYLFYVILLLILPNKINLKKSSNVIMGKSIFKIV